jgi:hypothetical protein
MVSVIAALAVAICAFALALLKGRTGWHWFILTLFAFAALWVMSALALYLAGIHTSFALADKELAEFVGGLTAIVVLVILLSVPNRPRASAVSIASSRDGPTTGDAR